MWVNGSTILVEHDPKNAAISTRSHNAPKQMFHPVYLLWFLLPLFLLGLAAWAVMKPLFGVPGKEDASDYFKQGMFALFAFVIAIFLDRLSFDEVLLSFTEDSQAVVNIVHWLLYPAVLLALAYANGLYKKWQGKDLASEASFGLARYKR